MNETHSRLASRRHVLKFAAGLVGLGWAGGVAAQTCFDRTKLPSGELSLRRSLNFKDRAPDMKRSCGGCAFFTATKLASCGGCALLSGGAVDATSVCDSWTAKG